MFNYCQSSLFEKHPSLEDQIKMIESHYENKDHQDFLIFQCLISELKENPSDNRKLINELYKMAINSQALTQDSFRRITFDDVILKSIYAACCCVSSTCCVGCTTGFICLANAPITASCNLSMWLVVPCAMLVASFLTGCTMGTLNNITDTEECIEFLKKNKEKETAFVSANSQENESDREIKELDRKLKRYLIETSRIEFKPIVMKSSRK